MSTAEIAGIVLGAIGAAAAVVHLCRSIWRKLQEERRWHCAFGGRLRYYYRTTHLSVNTEDDKMVNITPFDTDDTPMDWLGDWVECSHLCNASRSGICRENPIFTRHVLKVCMDVIRPYIPPRLRPVRTIMWTIPKDVALRDPHPVTGKYSPTTMFIISRYREEQTPDASGGEDQSDSQSESAS